MLFIKTLPNGQGLIGDFAIYELTETEHELANKRYLINKKYSKYAMENMDHIRLVKDALMESEYVYGTGFCDTIAECELFYKCECLQAQISDLKCIFGKINRISEEAINKINID